ncbi:hypothetical protein EXVG_00313 [Emiliania huxleyi virus 202]|nr:hypothetical protein EXVG_00313 [Emiliania huxleyi virus 202]AHA54239.1 hypothetical protein EhV18_00192 [Emiliania huxleyi virus 18]AHA55287.1 hypothetical protein EhV156_00191 [Emiliania huxleyi virus 156]
MFIEVIYCDNINVANYNALTKHTENAFIYVDDLHCHNQWQNYNNQTSIIILSFDGGIPQNTLLSLFKNDSIPQYNATPIKLNITTICIATNVKMTSWYTSDIDHKKYIIDRINSCKYIEPK